MIQRIQTLYLLIITILMTVMLFVPLACFTGYDGKFCLTVFGIDSVTEQTVKTTDVVGSIPANDTSSADTAGQEIIVTDSTPAAEPVVTAQEPNPADAVPDSAATAPVTDLADIDTTVGQAGNARTANPGFIIPVVFIGVLVILAGVWPLVTIFLFRRRRLQARFCIVELFLLLGVQAMVVYQLARIPRTVDGAVAYTAEYGLPGIFPLVGIVLAYLAYRAIKRDEALIRSIDRIR